MTPTVTPEKSVLDQLRASEDRFYKVFEASPSMIAITTVETGRIYEVNRAWLEVFGFNRNEVVGHTAFELNLWYDPGDREAFIEAFERQGSLRNYQVQMRTKTGESRHLLVNGDRIDFDNEERMMLVINDITARVEAENRLQDTLEHLEAQILRRTRELSHAKEAAETASQAKSQFLSAMSHELRTPLNAILGFAQLLEFDPDHPLAPAQAESVDHIKSGGKHLLTLINEILDLSKIESGNAEFDIEAVDFHRLIREIRPMAEALAKKASVSFEAPALELAKTVIAVDMIRAKQVLLNLLSNAIKYNAPNGRVVIDARLEPGQVAISVTDTGQGIPEHQLKELFVPFARLGAEETTIEGTGIGLTITKELVERMNGTIEVVSEVGRGSTFTVRLPIAQEAAAEEDTGDGEPFLEGPIQDTGFDGLVLYVEDNAANIFFMQSVFDRFANLQLITATNAEDGLRVAREQQPDMLLLDIALPGISGIEAVQRLRADDGFRNKPIIAISANAMVDDVQKGLKAGFDAYLTKPLDIKVLMAELEKVFGKVVLED